MTPPEITVMSGADRMVREQRSCKDIEGGYSRDLGEASHSGGS